ncbi:MAG: DUF2971 domain-containing protein [Myxococcota bacterium]
MFYYRFRPPTELAYKELLYDELYFASPAECNDPFDSHAFAEFSGDQDKWTRLLQLALGDLAKVFGEHVLERVAQALVQRAPLSLSAISASDALQSAFADSLPDPAPSHRATIGSVAVLKFIENYQPPDRYFASFSGFTDHPLLWSHYALGHIGHCLIFRPVAGQLRVDREREKPGIKRIGPGPIAPSMSFAMPKTFQFVNMSYVPQVAPACAFSCFPEKVYGENLTEELATQLRAEVDRHFFEKHDAWSYEREVRVTLSAPIPWLYGSRYQPSQQERLFHFDPTQLAGVIVGARASTESLDRILEIARSKRLHISRSVDYERTVTDFVVFKATLGAHERSIEVQPKMIFGLGDVIEATSEKFQQRLRAWEDGWGLKLGNGRATRAQLA